MPGPEEGLLQLVGRHRALGEGGVDQLSIRGLARATEVSHTAFRHHFGDRRGLLTALAGDGYASLTRPAGCAQRRVAAWRQRRAGAWRQQRAGAWHQQRAGGILGDRRRLHRVGAGPPRPLPGDVPPRPGRRG
ncbi:TetR/AcrR family transcriptional regulator [Ornithinimicrobium ciconiae]|uniref:TetR/AcrR family transcriptional regulator n=1 Tax=Ornithinimicrobium ciconiae TaxID=2594265 RepID=UPI001D185D6B|nr:TetR/AcrR family transcriptional regulator [Ornithinimicrobium ciconiae]